MEAGPYALGPTALVTFTRGFSLVLTRPVVLIAQSACTVNKPLRLVRYHKTPIISIAHPLLFPGNFVNVIVTKYYNT